MNLSLKTTTMDIVGAWQRGISCSLQARVVGVETLLPNAMAADGGHTRSGGGRRPLFDFSVDLFLRRW